MMKILGILLAILVAGACTSLGSDPEGTLVGCPLALAEGTLKEVAPDKLALQTDYAGLVEVRGSRSLPSAAGPPAQLVDTDGKVIARAGDRVSLTGGYLGESTFTQCASSRCCNPRRERGIRTTVPLSSDTTPNHHPADRNPPLRPPAAWPSRAASGPRSGGHAWPTSSILAQGHVTHPAYAGAIIQSPGREVVHRC